MIDRTRAPRWQLIAASAAAGLALGAATLLGQKLLPGAWSQLANSGAVWAAGAFAAGACLRVPAPLRAAVAGTLVLVCAVVGYYTLTTVLLHQDVSRAALAGPLAWSAVGLVAGPVFGIAGSWWRADRTGRRVAALALLGGVFVAEAADLLVRLHYAAEAGILLAIGISGAIAAANSNKDRWYFLAVLVPVAVIGFGGYLVLGAILEWIFK